MSCGRGAGDGAAGASSSGASVVGRAVHANAPMPRSRGFFACVSARASCSCGAGGNMIAVSLASSHDCRTRQSIAMTFPSAQVVGVEAYSDSR
eukprot:5682914-Prymnesium_polylepis.3